FHFRIFADSSQIGNAQNEVSVFPKNISGCNVKPLKIGRQKVGGDVEGGLINGRVKYPPVQDLWIYCARGLQFFRKKEGLLGPLSYFDTIFSFVDLFAFDDG